MSRVPKILGDALRAVALLSAEGRVRTDVLRMLGIALEAEAALWEGTGFPVDCDAQESLEEDSLPPRDVPMSMEDLDDPTPFDEGEALGLVSLDPAPVRLPPWIGVPMPVSDRPTAAPVPPEPLLMPAWTRSILALALGTSGGDGPYDLDSWTEQLAQLKCPDPEPRLPSRTLRRGVQVLCDRGEGMQPFREDQARLMADVARVVGRDGVDVRHFIGCPTRGCGAGPRRTWRGWEPPAGGRPVLLLTDLGIGRPSFAAPTSPAEWAAFAGTARAGGCPVLALVPYPPSRWPKGLETAITFLQWDRTTRPRSLSRLKEPTWA